MINLESVTKKIAKAAGIIVLTIFTSQCFAQSQSETAKNVTKRGRQYTEMVGALMDFIQQYYVDEVDAETLYKGALKGMFESLNDPYSLYLDSEAMRSLSDTTEGSFGGVGLYISKSFESTSDKPAYVEVTSPMEDTPGFRAGIQPGDLIISVEGIDTSTITMEEVLDKLRGPVGEEVHIVIRRGQNMEFPVTLTRALIEVPVVKYGIIPVGQKTKLGYMRLIQFTPQTVEHTQEAIDSFKAEGVSGVIIDLRNNPGGLITSVADIADKFIDSGPIVSTKSRIEYQNQVFTASPKNTTFMKGTPIVVLINKGSASASEILSGALKDYHLAYLVGQRTYGKGSVQTVWPFSKTEGVKMTIARYYTPSDVNIDKIGIPPDREILFPVLSEDGEKQYLELMKADEISKYVASHAGMSEDDISSYAKDLKKKYPSIDDASLRKLVRNEVNRTKGAMLYDLDYDVQLNEAINILTKENFQKLVKKTKTLKELQDAALLAESKDSKDKK